MKLNTALRLIQRQKKKNTALRKPQMRKFQQ